MIGWFIVPYRTRVFGSLGTIRYCAVDDYSTQIRNAGGLWREIEILGGRAIVKVRAPGAVLTALNGIPGFIRLPHDGPDDSLADLTAAQRNAIKTLVLDCGYSPIELQAALGNSLLDKTVGDVLRLLATRRAPGVKAESLSIMHSLVADT